jgi:hypothetical protein
MRGTASVAIAIATILAIGFIAANLVSHEDLNNNNEQHLSSEL